MTACNAQRLDIGLVMTASSAMHTEQELVIKVVAMPSDTNPDGDMFGGWILSQMDLAAYLHARKLGAAKVVTVAIDNIVFHKPVFVGDCLICYAATERIGRTSIIINVEAKVERQGSALQERVTEGRFVYVAIGEDRQPVPVVRDSSSQHTT